MPNQDGTLTGSDTITLGHAFDRMIPFEDTDSSPKSIGVLDQVHVRAESDPRTRSAFLRIVEALSLDMLAHAVGGFSALTVDEQIGCLHNVESTLRTEFSIVLGLVRDVYYDSERTPDRPKNFDSDLEIFGKIKIEDDLEPSRSSRRHARENSLST
jgi:hypothetical protein